MQTIEALPCARSCAGDPAQRSAHAQRGSRGRLGGQPSSGRHSAGAFAPAARTCCRATVNRPQAQLRFRGRPPGNAGRLARILPRHSRRWAGMSGFGPAAFIDIRPHAQRASRGTPEPPRLANPAAPPLTKSVTAGGVPPVPSPQPRDRAPGPGSTMATPTVGDGTQTNEKMRRLPSCAPAATRRTLQRSWCSQQRIEEE